jgi:hypothetical protein
MPLSPPALPLSLPPPTHAPQFLRVLSNRDGAGAARPLRSTQDALVDMLSELDEKKTGRIPLATLLHVLAEVAAPTALSLEEVQELLRLTGVLTPTTVADPKTLYAMEVDYRGFVGHLCFPPPPPPLGASSRGAAART